MLQDLSDTTLEIVPKPVNDPPQELLQVPENKMLCEPTKEHIEQKELLQMILEGPCPIHTEELPYEVLQEHLPCIEQVASDE